MTHNGPWKLTDLEKVEKNGLKVFSCFHCGGGSTMGYKLAGYEVLGGVEIDPKIMELYRVNFAPKFSYLMGVQDFNKIPNANIPDELYNLDILDGSPPCSSFSLAGNREKDWGKSKKFREGQSNQILDDLFFHFIDTARKLGPRMVIAENVRGLILGNARGYVKEIFQGFREAGYDCQLFLLNASRMGVPQIRMRTFFIARRMDLGLPKIALEFNEPLITVREAWKGLIGQKGRDLSERQLRFWPKMKPGDNEAKHNIKGIGFNHIKIALDNPSATYTASGPTYHPVECRGLSNIEFFRIQSFPDDYNLNNNEAQYICGMSVPPYMMERVASSLTPILLT
jgi:DNA (cytosine-5)-methyltransferase 1